jgi:hypothetical protein
MEVMFENQVKTLLLPDVMPMYARQALDNGRSGGMVSGRVRIHTSTNRISKRLLEDRWVGPSRRFSEHFLPPPGRLEATVRMVEKETKTVN